MSVSSFATCLSSLLFRDIRTFLFKSRLANGPGVGVMSFMHLVRRGGVPGGGSISSRFSRRHSI